MRRALMAAAAALVISAAGAAQATTITNGGFSLEDSSFGAGLGVHNDTTQLDTNTINALVNQDGSAVTFTSGELISDTGSGEATISGLYNDLNVSFAKSWDSITFALSLPNGPDAPKSSIMTLAVNGVLLFDNGNCSICTLAGGENKFTVSGSGINNLSFTFDPAIATAKQFRVEGLSAIPEPATWAIMLMGFGGLGATLRANRRKASLVRVSA